MMGIFNQKLAELAVAYAGQVVYVELLGTVKDDQWEDEIHPTNEGFREISLKFIKRIQEVLG